MKLIHQFTAFTGVEVELYESVDSVEADSTSTAKTYHAFVNGNEVPEIALMWFPAHSTLKAWETEVQEFLSDFADADNKMNIGRKRF